MLMRLASLRSQKDAEMRSNKFSKRRLSIFCCGGGEIPVGVIIVAVQCCCIVCAVAVSGGGPWFVLGHLEVVEL